MVEPRFPAYTIKAPTPIFAAIQTHLPSHPSIPSLSYTYKPALHPQLDHHHHLFSRTTPHTLSPPNPSSRPEAARLNNSIPSPPRTDLQPRDPGARGCPCYRASNGPQGGARSAGSHARVKETDSWRLKPRWCEMSMSGVEGLRVMMIL